ncbi:hypothetical protein chiPu_0025000, partial [Chiloscyllium punctatum]|nr:hypothetical protein [Chiloscyllium punctatum]
MFCRVHVEVVVQEVPLENQEQREHLEVTVPLVGLGKG